MTRSMKTLLFGIGLVFLIIITIIITPYYYVLAIEKENTGHTIAYLPIKKGFTFDIHYIHSIHLTPVIESYEVNKYEIVQKKLVYEQFGVGMPSNREGEEKFEEQDGKYILSNMDRSFSYIDLRIAQVMSDHFLIVDGRKIPFSSVSEPGNWIRLHVKRINLWTIMRGVENLE